MLVRCLKVFAIAVLLILPHVGRAAGGPGSAFGEGLRLTNTAWALGMSEAMTASAVGVSAISLNPAGVLDSTLTTLHLTHTFLVEGLAEDYFAYTQRLPFGSAFGISVHGLYDASTARTFEDASGNFGGEAGGFPIGFAVGGIVYALDLAPFLGQLDFLKPTGGAGLRVVWQQVGNYNWLGLTMDFGFKVRHRSGFMLGGVLQNAGVARGPSGLPLQWVTGVAWQGHGLLGRSDRFLVEVDSPVAVDRNLAVRIGSEYWVQFHKVSFAVRGGWKQELDVPDALGISAGFGFRWFMGWTPWGMDYALVPWGVFGNQHAISLTVGLTAKRKPKLAKGKPVGTETRPRDPVQAFYPLKGEAARYVFPVNAPMMFSADLLDAEGNFIMKLYAQQLVQVGTVEVIWAGWLPTGVMAFFDKIYRIRIRLGDQTWFKIVVLKME